MVADSSADIRRYVAARLKQFATELLDLSGRSRLLNYRESWTDRIGPVGFSSSLTIDAVFRYLDDGRRLEFPVSDTAAPTLMNPISSSRVLLGVPQMSPAQLRRALKKLSDAYNEGQREKGTNHVFAMFGFLEYVAGTVGTDGIEGDRRLAPVVLVPLEVQRVSRSGTWQYSFVSAGPAEVNPALAVLLSTNFNLDIPALEEGVQNSTTGLQLSTYFRAVERQIISRKPTWRLLPNLAVAALPARGRMVIYEDLSQGCSPNDDDAIWMANPWVANERVTKLLAGSTDSADTLQSADIHPVDSPALRGEIPVLPLPADSTQLSAVIDALRDRDLVIKGPPGTGKSQTIANLIAALLQRQKSVLFLADKAAALEVVQKRLDDVGLGPFCLQIHSQQATRTEVLRQVRSHLAAVRNRTARPAESLEEARTLYFDMLDDLNRRVALLGARLGETRYSIHSALAELDAVPGSRTSPSEMLSLAWVTKRITDRDIQEYVALCRRIELLRETLAQDFGVGAEHPWLQLHDDQLDNPDSIPTILDALRGYRDATARLAQASSMLLAEPTIADVNTISDSLLGSVAELGHPSPGRLRPKAIALLQESAKRQTYRSVLDLSDQMDGLTERIRALASSSPDPTQVLAAKDLLESRGLLGYSQSVLAWETDLAEACSRHNRLVGATDALNGLTTRLALPPLRSRDDVLAFSEGLDLAQQLRMLLHVRRRSLASPDALESVKRLGQRAAELRAASTEQAREFVVVSAQTSSDEVLRAAMSLRTAGMFSFLSKEDRAARRLYKALRRKDAPASVPAADALQTLGLHLRDIEAFRGSKEASSLLGDLFDGVETDFAPILACAEVLDAATRLRRHGELGSTLARVLMHGTNEEAASLADLPSPEESEAIGVLLSELSAEPDITALVVAKSSWIQSATEVLEALRSTHLREDIPFGPALTELFQVLGQRAENREASARFASALAELTEAGYDVSGRGDRVTLSQDLDLFDSLETVASYCEVPPLSDGGTISAFLAKTHSNISELAAAVAGLRRQRIQVDALFGSTPIPRLQDNQSPQSVVESCDELVGQHASLAVALQFLGAVRDGRRLGLLDGAPNGAVFDSNFFQDAHRRLLVTLLRLVFPDFRAIAEVSRTEMESLRERFADAGTRLRRLSSAAANSELRGRPHVSGVSRGKRSDWTEWSLLEHQASLTRPSLPLRSLLERSAHALKSNMPCWMMSPSSVAQFVSPTQRFDVVIIDEASQMRPEEAVTSIGRAERFVIVGDEQQLPPTSFFEADPFGNIPDEEQTESILELAAAVARPVRELLFHYRSRHEDLIRFSNTNFYDDRLQIFPSAERVLEGVPLGVIHHFVGGTYQGSGLNEEEAQVVAKAALEHMRTRADWSLGIAAVNQAQADAISNLLDQLVVRDPVAQRFLARWDSTTEPFFVKNLESVQGDERDVIMISTVYGKQQGQTRVQQTFGPINSLNGHRRLNVLITRAKYRCEVFTSMQSSDITPGPTTHRGVTVLRDYLAYAATGHLSRMIAPTDAPTGDFDSPFEEAVAAALGDAGWKVHTQVGVNGFRVDLAVVDPENPDRYITGIECDGATYHSSASARDRDLLRQEILESKGWRLYRIWSADWFADREAELSRVLRFLDDLVVKRNDGFVVPEVVGPAHAHAAPSLSVAIESSMETAQAPWTQTETAVADSASSTDGDERAEEIRRLIRWTVPERGRISWLALQESVAKALTEYLTDELRIEIDREVAALVAAKEIATDWHDFWRRD